LNGETINNRYGLIIDAVRVVSIDLDQYLFNYEITPIKKASQVTGFLFFAGCESGVNQPVCDQAKPEHNKAQNNMWKFFHQ